MGTPATASNDILELQDTVVTLRLNVPSLFKKMLLKECDLEHQRIITTDIDVPKQPIQELGRLERKQISESSHFDVAKDVQDVHQILNMMDKLFPVNNR